MKALVGAFNQEKALVGAFSVIVQPAVEPMGRFAALILCEKLSIIDCTFLTSGSGRLRWESGVVAGGVAGEADL